jgi:hypothetical protein
MTTPPYGETDPLSTTPSTPQHASTPIDDELSRESDFDTTTEYDTTSDFGTSSYDATIGEAPADDTTDGGGVGAAVGSAKETAQDAVSSASEHGAQVAGTAKEEATKVAAEAKDKATDLLADVKSQVDEQSKTQLTNLASKLGELADEIQSLVDGSDASGTVSGVAQQLADKTHQLSSHLDSRQPLDLLDDVRTFARRRPGAFLAGAAVAGVVAGRLTRGAKASHDTDSTTGAGSTTTGTTTTGGYTGVPATATVSDPPFLGSTPPADTFPLADDVPDGQNTGGRQ